MSLRVSGKNLDIGDTLRDRMQDRIADAIEKYFDRGWSGHVTVEREGSGFRTECALHLSSGMELHARAIAPDAYLSCDAAMERIEKRLRRYKRRLRESHPREGAAAIAANLAPTYVMEVPEEHDVEPEEPGDHPVVIAEMTTMVARQSVAQAVGDLDLTGMPVVVFRHATSGRINIVYRRPDGHIGWIDPPVGDPH